MAFPTVPTTAANTLLSSTTTTASTTHTFPSLTTLAPQAGDLLIAICVQYTGTSGGSPNDQFSSWGAGFTETLDDETTTADQLALGVAHKVATGSESGTFTVTSAAAARSVNFLMRIPAATWHGTTIPEVLAAVRATNAVADPGSFNPANWDVEDTLWISVYGHSETSTTGNPPTIDTPPSNYTGQLIVARNADAVGHITAAVAFRQLNAASDDVGTWTVSNANRGNGLATVIGVRPKPPQQKTITEVPESDSAQAVAFVQGNVSIGGAASETDLANAVVPLQTLPASETSEAQTLTYEQASEQHKDITAAVETDTAGMLLVPRLSVAAETSAAEALDFDKPIYQTAGEAAETDTAEALTFAQASDYDITLVAETDVAGSLRAPRILTAAETDTAQAVTYSQAGAYELTAAAETSAAGAVTAAKQATVGEATETDLANEIVELQVLAALEVDTAETLSFTQAGIALTPAAESDTAEAVAAAKAVTLPEYEATPPIPYGTVTIGDTAAALELSFTQTGPTSYNITPASESDSVQTVDADKQATLAVAAEADTAEAVAYSQVSDFDLTLAAETDAAQTLTYSQAGAYSVAPAQETDAAVAVVFTKTIYKTLGAVAETDTAQAVSYTGPTLVTLNPAAETNTVQTVGTSRTRSLTLAGETDAAVAVTHTRVLTIGPALETSTAQPFTLHKTLSVTFAGETDAAVGLPYGGVYDFTHAGETNTATALRYAAMPPSGTLGVSSRGRIRRTQTGRVNRTRQGVLG